MTFEEVKELIKVVSESNVTDFTYKSQIEGNEFVIKMGKQAGRVVTESCQALKTLGRINVTAKIIQTLSEKLTEDEKRACLKEATESTDWVYDTIRKICGGDTQ